MCVSTSSVSGTSSPGRPSTGSVCAGRPFFMTIGISHASAAPASRRRPRTPGHTRGSRSSTLASSTTVAGLRRPATGSCRRAPDDDADHVGPPRTSRPPAPTPASSTLIGGRSSQPPRERPQQRHPGRRRELAGAGGRSTSHPRQLEHRRHRHRQDAVRRADRPGADRDGREHDPDDVQAATPAQCPRRRRSHRARRPRGSAPRPAGRRARAPPPRRGARRPQRHLADPLVSAARPISSRMSAQLRDVPSSAASTST